MRKLTPPGLWLPPRYRRGFNRFAPACCCDTEGPDLSDCDLTDFPCTTGTIPSSFEIEVPVDTFPTACGYLDYPCCCKNREGTYVLNWKGMSFSGSGVQCHWVYCSPNADGTECPRYGVNTGSAGCTNATCDCCPPFYYELVWESYDASNKALSLYLDESMTEIPVSGGYNEVGDNNCSNWVNGAIAGYHVWQAIVPNDTDCSTIDEDLAWSSSPFFPTCDNVDTSKLIHATAIG